MGRFLVFLIVLAAAGFAVWKYVPGGKDMLLKAKDVAMSVSPLKKDDAADAAAEPAAPAAEPVVEAAPAPAVEEAAPAEGAAEEAPSN